MREGNGKVAEGAPRAAQQHCPWVAGAACPDLYGCLMGTCVERAKAIVAPVAPTREGGGTGLSLSDTGDHDHSCGLFDVHAGLCRCDCGAVEISDANGRLHWHTPSRVGCSDTKSGFSARSDSDAPENHSPAAVSRSTEAEND